MSKFDDFLLGPFQETIYNIFGCESVDCTEETKIYGELGLCKECTRRHELYLVKRRAWHAQELKEEEQERKLWGLDYRE